MSTGAIRIPWYVEREVLPRTPVGIDGIVHVEAGDERQTSASPTVAASGFKEEFDDDGQRGSKCQDGTAAYPDAPSAATVTVIDDAS